MIGNPSDTSVISAERTMSTRESCSPWLFTVPTMFCSDRATAENSDAVFTISVKRDAATRESMREAASRFTDMVNTASEFSAVARSLQNIVGTVNNQGEQLSRVLMVLSALITEVSEGLPIIEQRISQMIGRSGQGVRPNQETVGAVPRHPAESIQATRAQR